MTPIMNDGTSHHPTLTVTESSELGLEKAYVVLNKFFSNVVVHEDDHNVPVFNSEFKTCTDTISVEDITKTSIKVSWSRSFTPKKCYLYDIVIRH